MQAYCPYCMHDFAETINYNGGSEDDAAFCRKCKNIFELPIKLDLTPEQIAERVERGNARAKEIAVCERQRLIDACGTRSIVRVFNSMYAYTKIMEANSVGDHILKGLYIDHAYIGVDRRRSR